jgi:hypothetical protein
MLSRRRRKMFSAISMVLGESTNWLKDEIICQLGTVFKLY